jgi:hypothetical protein
MLAKLGLSCGGEPHDANAGRRTAGSRNLPWKEFPIMEKLCRIRLALKLRQATRELLGQIGRLT